MLVPASDSLTANSVTAALGAATPAQVLPINTVRNGARLWADSANAAPVYVIFGASTNVPSATNFHVVIPAGTGASVTVSERLVWRGAVQAFSASAAKLGVTEA